MFDNGAVLANIEQSMASLATSRHLAEFKAVPPRVTFGSSYELCTVHEQ